MVKNFIEGAVKQPVPEVKADPVPNRPEVKKTSNPEESSEQEKTHLREVDEQLEKLTAGIKIDKKPPIAQLVPSLNKPSKSDDPDDNYDQDKFE